MERIPKGIYTKEFREQAVRLHEVDGLTIPEVAKLTTGRFKRVHGVRYRAREEMTVEGRIH